MPYAREVKRLNRGDATQLVDNDLDKRCPFAVVEHEAWLDPGNAMQPLYTPP